MDQKSRGIRDSGGGNDNMVGKSISSKALSHPPVTKVRRRADMDVNKRDLNTSCAISNRGNENAFGAHLNKKDGQNEPIPGTAELGRPVWRSRSYRNRAGLRGGRRSNDWNCQEGGGDSSAEDEGESGRRAALSAPARVSTTTNAASQEEEKEEDATMASMAAAASAGSSFGGSFGVGGSGFRIRSDTGVGTRREGGSINNRTATWRSHQMLKSQALAEGSVSRLPVAPPTLSQRIPLSATAAARAMAEADAAANGKTVDSAAADAAAAAAAAANAYANSNANATVKEREYFADELPMPSSPPFSDDESLQIAHGHSLIRRQQQQQQPGTLASSNIASTTTSSNSATAAILYRKTSARGKRRTASVNDPYLAALTGLKPPPSEAIGGLKAEGRSEGVERQGPAVVSTNFKRLNLRRGKSGFRLGARARYSRAYKRKNHRNHVGKNFCYSCGKEGHWSKDCPKTGGSGVTAHSGMGERAGTATVAELPYDPLDEETAPHTQHEDGQQRPRQQSETEEDAFEAAAAAVASVASVVGEYEGPSNATADFTTAATAKARKPPARSNNSSSSSSSSKSTRGGPTVAQLREQLRARGLTVTGNKAALLSRLQSSGDGDSVGDRRTTTPVPHDSAITSDSAPSSLVRLRRGTRRRLARVIVSSSEEEEGRELEEQEPEEQEPEERDLADSDRRRKGFTPRLRRRRRTSALQPDDFEGAFDFPDSPVASDVTHVAPGGEVYNVALDSDAHDEWLPDEADGEGGHMQTVNSGPETATASARQSRKSDSTTTTTTTTTAIMAAGEQKESSITVVVSDCEGDSLVAPPPAKRSRGTTMDISTPTLSSGGDSKKKKRGGGAGGFPAARRANNLLPLPDDWAGSPPSSDQLHACLTSVFGHDEFRPGQQVAVERVLRGQSTLVVQSTASGKSLCYQLPAAMLTSQFRCLILVVSPLVSLMQDQIARLPRRLRGGTLNSGMSKKQRDKAFEDVLTGRTKVLFVAPETLVSPNFLYLVRNSRMPPVPFACVDEAHCVSEWSHNFRPSYLRLARILRKALGVKCLLGLTATATLSTEASVAHHLGVSDDGVVRGAPVPSNLHLAASCPRDRRSELLHLLRTHHRYRNGAAIVYCTQQSETERLAAFLRTNDVDARAYHAGMRPPARRRVQNDFMDSKLRVVVATIAFGMGLDKSDIRVVVHYNLPKSIENYVQEVGRAGRDGQAAHCHVFVDEDDLQVLRCHAYGDTVDDIFIKRLMRMIFVVSENEHDKRMLCCEAAAACGPAGIALLERSCKPTYVCLPIEHVNETLDMKESVFTTMLSTLELGHSDLLRQLAPIQCAAVVRILDPGFAASDPVLAACCACGSLLPGGRRGEHVVEVCTVANSLGLAPSEVIRALYSMRGARRIGLELTRPGACLQLLRPIAPTDDEWDALMDELVERMHTLERAQLHKIGRFRAMMAEAMEAEPVPLEDGSGELELRSAAVSRVIRGHIETYFSLDAKALAAAAMAEASRATKAALTALGPVGQRQLRRDVSTFVASFMGSRGDDHRLDSGRAVARILHGIGSPRYPVYAWRDHPMWRRYISTDFYLLRQIATEELVRLRTQ